MASSTEKLSPSRSLLTWLLEMPSIPRALTRSSTERAVALYAAGSSLTQAAHEAGFADSAHLSRTFRRTFGLPAAGLRLHHG